MKNNRGFTVVELIVSFGISMVVLIFLFELVMMVRGMYISYGLKTELLTKQGVISDRINSDFINKDLLIAAKEGPDTINFYYSDNTNRKLIINRDQGVLSYGGYTVALFENSSFGNIKISNETLLKAESPGAFDSILIIQIPIYHKLLPREDFGINIALQYNSDNVVINDVDIEDEIDSDRRIFLTGGNDIISFTSGASFVEPGWFVVYDNGLMVPNDESVTRTGTVGTTIGETYQLTYTSKDSGGNVLAEVVRKVTLLATEYVFDYRHGGTQQFTAPVAGTYKFEVWGAQGGTFGSAQGGNGGYAVANISLSQNETVMITIGGQGNPRGHGSPGENGGGTGGTGTTEVGSGGGGATDIRIGGTSLTFRQLIAGGGGGSAGSGTVAGGVGGGLTGMASTGGTASYNGGGATNTTGGARATYNTTITLAPLNGSLGQGGNGGIFNSITGGGGGGGGYYGGGGGVRSGSGGGGSAFCGSRTILCSTLRGDQSMPNPAGGANITGKTGNGYARISIVSANHS